MLYGSGESISRGLFRSDVQLPLHTPSWVHPCCMASTRTSLKLGRSYKDLICIDSVTLEFPVVLNAELSSSRATSFVSLSPVCLLAHSQTTACSWAVLQVSKLQITLFWSCKYCDNSRYGSDALPVASQSSHPTHYSHLKFPSCSVLEARFSICSLNEAPAHDVGNPSIAGWLRELLALSLCHLVHDSLVCSPLCLRNAPSLDVSRSLPLVDGRAALREDPLARSGLMSSVEVSLC